MLQKYPLKSKRTVMGNKSRLILKESWMNTGTTRQAADRKELGAVGHLYIK